nr:FAD-dependent oxidoreductase [Desulfolucanica intricata]
MTFKVVVIGGGPGGYVAAIRAAQLGAKVAMVEKAEVGGTCLNRGCIPTKALVSGVEALHIVRRAAEFGITCGDVAVDVNKLFKRKDQVVAQLVQGIQFLLKKRLVNRLW